MKYVPYVGFVINNHATVMTNFVFVIIIKNK
jgi:hypothetical protein